MEVLKKQTRKYQTWERNEVVLQQKYKKQSLIERQQSMRNLRQRIVADGRVSKVKHKERKDH